MPGSLLQAKHPLPVFPYTQFSTESILVPTSPWNSKRPTIATGARVDSPSPSRIGPDADQSPRAPGLVGLARAHTWLTYVCPYPRPSAVRKREKLFFSPNERQTVEPRTPRTSRKPLADCNAGNDVRRPRGPLPSSPLPRSLSVPSSLRRLYPSPTACSIGPRWPQRPLLPVHSPRSRYTARHAAPRY